MSIYKQEKGNDKGFTMIELLITMTILGVLAAFFINVFPASQKRARDTQRISDLNQYRISLETHAGNNDGLFPSRTTATGENIAAGNLCGDLGLSTCIQDPLNPTNSSYVYKYQSNGTGSGNNDASIYILWTNTLENSTDKWVYCSTGLSGEVAAASLPPSAGNEGTCPL